MRVVGSFRDGHPRVTLEIPAANENSEQIEFILDTGFHGGITLPSSVVRSLHLEVHGHIVRRLADGSVFQCEVCEILLVVDDEETPTEVLVLENDPLLGTLLLTDHTVQMDFVDGGDVIIEPL